MNGVLIGILVFDTTDPLPHLSFFSGGACFGSFHAGSAMTRLIFAYQLRQFAFLTMFSLSWCRISTSHQVCTLKMVSDIRAIIPLGPPIRTLLSCLRCGANRLNPLLYNTVCECEDRSLSLLTLSCVQFSSSQLVGLPWQFFLNLPHRCPPPPPMI